MGLKVASDLQAWKEWQRGSSLIQRWRGHLASEQARPLVLNSNGDRPSILVALDSVKPSSVAAYMAPLRELSGEQIAVLAPGDVSSDLGPGWAATTVVASKRPRNLESVRAVFSGGHYLPVGGAAYDWSVQLGARYVVAQHGLMTPFAPPLAPGSHLLAFSEADALFWKSGRTDVTHEVVGAQLLWDAARRRGPDAALDARPVFLGQLHGAELGRRISARSAVSFCLRQGADYRPHPAETDKLSRLQHALWKRRGVRFENSGKPLAELDRPVVGVYSTGILEAAAAGRPAWVTADRPPEWVRDFWRRYGLSEWGQDPTPVPEIPAVEPAQAIAAALDRIIRGAS